MSEIDSAHEIECVCEVWYKLSKTHHQFAFSKMSKICQGKYLKCFSFVSICKLLTAGLQEQKINVTQQWRGILKFSRKWTKFRSGCFKCLPSRSHISRSLIQPRTAISK